MLNTDFSDTTDWNRLPGYLTYDELNALDFSEPKTAAIPGFHRRKASKAMIPASGALHERVRICLPSGRVYRNMYSMSTTVTQN